MPLQISIDKKQLTTVCEEYRIQRLAVFGSAVRKDFQASSDIDVLVEFCPGETPSLLKFPDIIEKLSRAFGGRPVDLVTYRSLNRRIRDTVLAEAEEQYVKAG